MEDLSVRMSRVASREKLLNGFGLDRVRDREEDESEEMRGAAEGAMIK